MTTEFIWQHLDAPGWEHVRMMTDHPGWTVFDSIFVREHAEQVLRGGYTLVIDRQWRTLELRLMLETAPGAMEGIHLLTEGDGHWTDAQDNPLPELDGCLDVDIQWSPLTKSLSVNRLHMKVEQEQRIRVASISLPEMSTTPLTQRYRRVGESIVQFSWSDDCPSSDLTIDDDGFVMSYPSRFTRSWPTSGDGN